MLELFFILYAIADVGCDVPADDSVVCQFAQQSWCSSSFGCPLTPDRIELAADPDGLCEVTAGPQNTRSTSLGPVPDLPPGAAILVSEMVSEQRFVFRNLPEGQYCGRATAASDPDIVDQFVVLVREETPRARPIRVSDPIPVN